MTTQSSQDDLQVLLTLLPDRIRTKIREIGHEENLLEIIMDLGRGPTARYVDGELILQEEEISQPEIDLVVNGIGDFDDDNRAGIARTLHRISGIRNRRQQVVGLTCRVGRAVYGTTDIIADIVDSGKSILLLGRPGVGKTTMLREMARVLAETRRVVIVDTSNEIGGDGDIPHPAIGRARRMQVPRPSYQHETMIEAVENHNPEVIIIDEIGRELEAAAARTINERGVQLIGTAHGNTLENLLLNPTISDLVGGIESVTLSDDEARRRGTQKTVLERRAPPTFDVLIEIQGRRHMLVHEDVTSAVDAMLLGRPLDVESRFVDDAEEIHVTYEKMTLTSTAVTGRRDGRGRRDSDGGSYRSISSSHSKQTNGRNGHAVESNGTSEEELDNSLNIYAYGVARNRLIQAAKRLKVHIYMVDQLADADVMVTLKSYYRKRRRMIGDAERRRIPVYVLRANTVSQMEQFLSQALNLGLPAEEEETDPFDVAMVEAQRAIEQINMGKSNISLTPVNADLRRQQHQMARQANLVSHSYGKEPYRYVRMFNSKREE
jgi:stage III sporulation protein SpoIIIAA